MPIAVPDTRSELAQAYADLALYAALHSADPGETGDNEITSIPREAITWSPAGDGTQLTDELTFTIATPMFVSHIGIHSALTAGVFRDSFEVNSDLPAGDYKIILRYTQD